VEGGRHISSAWGGEISAKENPGRGNQTIGKKKKKEKGQIERKGRGFQKAEKEAGARAKNEKSNNEKRPCARKKKGALGKSEAG